MEIGVCESEVLRREEEEECEEGEGKESEGEGECEDPKAVFYELQEILVSVDRAL